ncbi:MAG: SCP2 sterol-binding domain-containing protein [Gammaproteobacteria bacterium]|nr:SCP2 sterol-binding domain-containing protein [Gammaproteobacteria bacterium]
MQGETRRALHLALAQSALNGCLALDEGARARLLAMDGQTLTIEVRGLQRQYSLQARDGHCHLISGGLDAADATLRGAPLALWNMIASDGVRALFSGQVEIHGDVEVAKRFKRLFDTLDIDWEEQLAGFIGDYPARRAMRLLSALGVWRRRSSAVLSEDIGDYLSEEKQLLGNANQIADLHDAVDELRDDVARLNARVARCEQDQRDA